MAVARKIAYIVILNSFLKVFSTVALSLLSIRLITGYLGQDGFGDYATILAFFAFFSAIADLGIGSVGAREISRKGADEAKILGYVIALRLTSSTLLAALSPLVILFFDYSADVKTGILIAAAGTIFSTLSFALNGIFQKHLAMDRVAMIEFLGKLLQVGTVFIAVHNDWGFLAIAFTLIVSLAFNATAALILSRRYVSFHLDFDTASWRSFLHESWPMGMTAIITFAYFKMDTILLSVLQTSSDVGIYNVAYKIMENLIFFPAMLAGLILPLLSHSIFSDRKHFEEIANKTFKVFLIIVLPLIIGAWFLSSDVIRIVSGSGFEASAAVLRILVFALGFIFFGHYFNMLLVVGNAQKKLMQTLVIAAVFNVLINMFLIRQYSYMGAASASLMTELLVVTLTGFLSYRYIHFIPSFERLGSIALSGTLMAVTLFLSSPFPFLVKGVLGVGAYLATLWATKAVDHTELVSLFQKNGSTAEEVEQMETMLP